MDNIHCSRKISILEFHPAADGVTDDTAAFLACFESAGPGTLIIIEPGRYLLSGEHPVLLHSDITIMAYGAEFFWPKELGRMPHRVQFYGENISDFTWMGGKFTGYVFSPSQADNAWTPDANTRSIVIEAKNGGTVKNLLFERISGQGVAGAVVTVIGQRSSEQTVSNPAYSVDVRDCVFEACGKFMWDYGYLWQRIVFPELHRPEEANTARRYMPAEYLSGRVSMAQGADYAVVEALPRDHGVGVDSVTFFGAGLPENIVKGKRYWVLKEESGRLWVSEKQGGKPIEFASVNPGEAYLIRNCELAYNHMYAPMGAGPGKGGLDLQACTDVTVTGCRMSALGDTMHIQNAENVVFSANQITGSRMGAFFIAEHCKNVTVIGNTVNGTNGSRVMSVERSATDITIVGNTFRGGGRGSWINQPYNIIIAENVFIENTTKGTPDPQLGRIQMATAAYERYPELYFTTWQPGASYGPVIVRSNLFQTGIGCSAAMAFHKGGHDIVVEGNIIGGNARDIYVEPGCERPLFANNIGMGEIVDSI